MDKIEVTIEVDQRRRPPRFIESSVLSPLAGYASYFFIRADANSADGRYHFVYMGRIWRREILCGVTPIAEGLMSAQSVDSS